MAANPATDRPCGRLRWAFGLIAATTSVTLGGCAASGSTIAPSASAVPTTVPSSFGTTGQRHLATSAIAD